MPKASEIKKGFAIESNGKTLLVKDIEVTTPVEDAGVDQFVFGLIPAAPGVLGDQVLVGETCLRVLVKPPHEAVGGGIGEVEVVVLEVLSMVALPVGQAKGPLLEDRIKAIPKRQGETKPALGITDPQQSVLAPAVHP